VAPGELLDKITILQIKTDRLLDADKLRHVRAELKLLEGVRARELAASAEVTRLELELRHVNEILWDVEDTIRVCEREREFGPRFIELARSVYRLNDQRAALKRRINELLGSPLVEQKSYPAYREEGLRDNEMRK
jgi:hypothetical protein